MAIPNGIQTAALIAGTVITASGLNLGVIGLGQPDAATEAGTVESGPTPGAPKADVAASGDPDGLVVAAAPLEHERGAEAQPNPSLPVVTLPPGGPLADPAPSGSTGSAGPSGSGTKTQRPPSQPAGGPAAPAAQPQAAQPQAERPPAPSQPSPPSSSALPTASLPPASTQPSGPLATAPPTQPPPPPPASQTEYLTYEFTGIADIVVALHDGNRLEFWSADKAPGWVSRVDDNGAQKVKVKFMRLSDGEEAEFVVRLNGDGDLDVKMED